MNHHRRVEQFHLNERTETRDPERELQTARELATLTRRQGNTEAALYWEKRAAYLAGTR